MGGAGVARQLLPHSTPEFIAGLKNAAVPYETCRHVEGRKKSLPIKSQSKADGF